MQSIFETLTLAYLREINERTKRMALDLTHLVAASARVAKDLGTISADLKTAIANNDPAALVAAQAKIEEVATTLDTAATAAEAVAASVAAPAPIGATGPAA